MKFNTAAELREVTKKAIALRENICTDCLIADIDNKLKNCADVCLDSASFNKSDFRIYANLDLVFMKIKENGFFIKKTDGTEMTHNEFVSKETDTLFEINWK